MHFQVSKSREVLFHLIAYRKLFLCLKLRQHMFFLCHGSKPFLILRCHTSGNIPLHRRLIAIPEMNFPVHPYPLTVPIDLTFSRVEIYLIDPQVIHTKRVQYIVAALLKFPKHVAPLERRYNKVCRRLEDIRRIFERLRRRIVHAIKADNFFPVTERNDYQGMNVLPL